MEDLGIDGRIILNFILKMYGSRVWSTSTLLRIRTTDRHMQTCSDPSCCTKGRKLEDSAPGSLVILSLSIMRCITSVVYCPVHESVLYGVVT